LVEGRDQVVARADDLHEDGTANAIDRALRQPVSRERTTIGNPMQACLDDERCAETDVEDGWSPARLEMPDEGGQIEQECVVPTPPVGDRPAAIERGDQDDALDKVGPGARLAAIEISLFSEALRARPDATR
jgi:hypothetical protein